MHRLRSVRRKRSSPMAGSRPSPVKCLADAGRMRLLACAITIVALIGTAHAQEGLRPYVVVGDAIPASLTGVPGDATRGRAIVGNRQVGLCLLCHSGPFPEER